SEPVEGSIALIDAIETVILSLDSQQSAMVHRGKNEYLWKFRYGTVEVFVQLTGVTEEDLLQVWSVVLPLPAKNEMQLLQKLLTMNWSNTLEARFAIADQQVMVMTCRSVEDLSASEVSRAITMVATLADDYDEPLQAEFSLA
ncbi:MAG: YbjN domain-containing protein, partial [Synechococcales bacterium]|nr:YbjN domain-containing protein [Synechococcales bacterium]